MKCQINEWLTGKQRKMAVNWHCMPIVYAERVKFCIKPIQNERNTGFVLEQLSSNQYPFI